VGVTINIKTTQGFSSRTPRNSYSVAELCFVQEFSHEDVARISAPRGDHWAKIVEQRAIKIGSNIFIVGKFCKNISCKIGDFIIVKHVYM
jgi:hypothetical protein